MVDFISRGCQVFENPDTRELDVLFVTCSMNIIEVNSADNSIKTL